MKHRHFSKNEPDYTGRETLGDLEQARNYNNHLIEIIQRHLTKKDIVADFGAGNGQFAAKLQLEVQTLFAIEPDTTLANQIEARGVTTTTLGELADGTLNVIYSLNVLEHIEMDSDTLLELRQKLVPGGRLVLYVPAFEILYSKFDERIGHYRRYSRHGLKSLMHKTGFDIKSISYFDPIGFFAALAYRVLDNSGKVNTRQIQIFDNYFYPLSRAIQPLTQKFIGKNLLVVAVARSAPIT